MRDETEDSNYYRLPHPGILWNGEHGETLPEDGGKRRPAGRKQVIAIDAKEPCAMQDVEHGLAHRKFGDSRG